MSIELSHIVIPARSKWASATFLASTLDVPAGADREPFVSVRLSNGAAVDYVDAERFDPHHCTFLASEADFDATYARIRSTGITYNHLRGGRGVSFDDPDGHHIEIITRPHEIR